jgi:hypothetical protein
MRNMSAAVAALLVLGFPGWCGAAEPPAARDGNGREALLDRADGTRLVRTFAPSGDLVKSEASTGERLDFDKRSQMQRDRQAPVGAARGMKP